MSVSIYDMADPDDPRHFEAFVPTPEQKARAEAAARELLAEFGPDPDGGDTFGEGADPKPDYPEPEPKKCPRCGGEMGWTGPEDYGDMGRGDCLRCDLSRVFDAGFRAWIYTEEINGIEIEYTMVESDREVLEK